MRNIDLPENVRYIIEKFDEFGYDAYAVGGCVRDSILGKNPSDWDICTNALPNQTKEVFSEHRIIETGIKHGTVTLIVKDSQYEITTFRTEGKYSDCRRPDKVEFVRNIAEDLSRRDFTVNAMAYNEKNGLIDLFSGSEDLKNGIIRCVGNPHERFSEDSLRIMRAVRFSAVLGFDIEKETEKAAREKRMLLENAAIERLNTEFTKALLSDNPIKLYKYKDIISVFIGNAENIKESDICALSFIGMNKVQRLAVYMLSLFKNYEDKSVRIREMLRYMRYDNETIVNTVNSAVCPIPSDLKECRILAGKYGCDIVINAMTVNMAFAKAQDKSDIVDKCSKALDFVKQIRENKLCVKVAELEVKGRDLAENGIEAGVAMGRLLEQLLHAVIEEKVENSKEALIKYVNEYLR